MSRYRKKPVVIEARQMDGGNARDLADWVNDNGGDAWTDIAASVVCIRTLEGTMRADLSDWIIKGTKGEFYPCKPDIFEAVYEPATDADGEPDVHR